MKKHVKVYLNHFDIVPGEFIACENCGCQSVDIHHLKFKSQCGKDEIENLVALCRNCHEIAHNSKGICENTAR